MCLSRMSLPRRFGFAPTLCYPERIFAPEVQPGPGLIKKNWSLSLLDLKRRNRNP